MGKRCGGRLGTQLLTSPASISSHFMYEVSTGIVLAQREVESKENEIRAIKDMLTSSLVKGRLLSADAMPTQGWFCQQVKRLEGDYLPIAKDNQPTMRQDVALFFEDPGAERLDWQTVTSTNKGHGRLETRMVTSSSMLRDWFAKEWGGIEQVFRIERIVKRDGKESREVIYGITSRSAKQADAAQIGTWVRDHWSIENRNHGRRDWTLREDQSQVRTEHVPAMLALLNSTVLSLMDRLGVRNIPAQMRRFRAHPHEALPLPAA